MITFAANGTNVQRHDRGEEYDEQIAGSLSVSLSVSFKATSAIRDVRAVVVQAAEKLNTIDNAITEWKAFQSNIPRQERRYRAELAKFQLAREPHGAGQALLDQLLGRVDEDAAAVLAKTGLTLE